ncbi:uncharacterized protein LOC110855261 [Folsomia candida]|uniref:uncharacterized protein LOC110855261 n=1 Tax=Folsomia candida TaxID=158441 RepID=UPI000B90464A|nr:uncharacterized protein LOC110855261 [Folsomia candida]
MGGVATFYLNAIASALFSISANNVLQFGSKEADYHEPGRTWSMCGRENLPLNNSYCDEFDVKMNLALAQLSWAIDAMKNNLEGQNWMSTSLNGTPNWETIRPRKMVGGFNPPDPDEVQKEIDDLKEEIVDLQTKLAQIDVNGDIDKVESQMAVVQEEIAQLTTKMDSLMQEAQDTFKDQIETLVTSLSAISTAAYTLKITVANLEKDLEDYKIINIMHEIVRGPDSGTAYLFEKGSFKGSMTTVLSSLVSLSYVEVLNDNEFILKIFKFLSLLEDKYKLDGCKHLYYIIVLSNHFYNKPQPFLVAHMLTSLLQSDDPNVANGASNFLNSVVSPIVKFIASDKNANNEPLCHAQYINNVIAPCTVVAAGDGFAFDDSHVIGNSAFQFGSNYDDGLMIGDDCAVATGFMEVPHAVMKESAHFCFSLQPGARLNRRVIYDADFDPSDFVRSRWKYADQSPCLGCRSAKCYLILYPQALANDEMTYWSLFGGGVACESV